MPMPALGTTAREAPEPHSSSALSIPQLGTSLIVIVIVIVIVSRLQNETHGWFAFLVSVGV